VESEVLTTIARIVARKGGDARIAIEILWRAGKHADRLGDSIIRSHHLDSKQLAQVKPLSSPSTSLDLDLSPHEMLLLKALHFSVSNNQTEKITMGQLKNCYQGLCAKRGEKPRHHTQLWKLIGRLRGKNLIQSEVGPHPQSRGRTTLLQLSDLQQWEDPLL